MKMNLDISPEADLDKLFRPLENYRTSDMLLGMDKVRRYLLDENIIDDEGFIVYVYTL